MVYTDQIGKLDCRYAIILLLCLLLLVASHINWNTKGLVRTRKTVIIVSKRTIKADKAYQSLNLTQLGV